MGRARSSPAFNYYTRITSPMTLLPSSSTVRGFTANNLRGSVRYLRRPLAAAWAPDRTRLHGNGLLDGSLGGRRGVRGGSHGGACFETGPAACQTACSCIASADGSDRDVPGVLPDGLLVALRRMVRRMPSGVPDGLRISFRFETGPAACPTARSCRFGGSALRRMVRFEMGPRWPGGPVRGDGSLDDCFTGKIR